MRLGKTASVMLIGVCIFIGSIWLVPQRYIGDYRPLGPFIFAAWLFALAGLAVVGAATCLNAIAAKRLPWPETLVSLAVYVGVEIVWRTTAGQDLDLSKLSWMWVGLATPLIAIVVWIVAAILVFKWRRVVERHKAT